MPTSVEPPVGALSLASHLSIRNLTDHWQATAPDRLFLAWTTTDDDSIAMNGLTWQQFSVARDAVAGFLQGLGVGPGDSVVLHAENSPEAVLMIAASALLGCRLVPSNWRLTTAELEYILRDCEAQVLISGPRQLAVAQSAAGLVSHCRTFGLQQLREMWQGAVSDGAGPELAAGLRGSSLSDVAVLYTSGTTSAPKGVRISEAALVHAGFHISGFSGMTSEDRNLTVLPISHINGLCYSLMTALATGGSMCVVDRFSASRYWEHVRVSGATIGWLAGTPMRLILGQPQRESDRGHSMRLVMYGQNLAGEGFEEWQRRFGTELHQIYGSTETVTLPVSNRRSGPRDPRALGVPSAGVVARVVPMVREGRGPTDDGSANIGELQLRLTPGHHMMSGYLNQPEVTAARFTPDGWFRTGDIVRVEEDGFLYFVDRDGDIIKVKGENVSAGEVESAIEVQPGVAEVTVVGVDDPLTDQAIWAFVVAGEPPLDVERLRQALAARLAEFKLPRRIIEVPALPRTDTGKVQKSVLVAQFRGAPSEA